MDLPEKIGVMILPKVTLFPQAMLPLYIFEPRYQKMLHASLDTHRLFCVAMQKPGLEREIPEPVAGVGLIRASVGHRNGTSHIVLQGLTRVRLGKASQYKPFRAHEIRALPTTGADGKVVAKRLEHVKRLVARRLELGLIQTEPGEENAEKSRDVLVKAQDIMRYLDSLNDPEQIGDVVACSLLQNAMHRQAILETGDLELRLRQLANCLGREIADLGHGDSLV